VSGEGYRFLLLVGEFDFSGVRSPFVHAAPVIVIGPVLSRVRMAGGVIVHW
jgi:hypothetical protein